MPRERRKMVPMIAMLSFSLGLFALTGGAVKLEKKPAARADFVNVRRFNPRFVVSLREWCCFIVISLSDILIRRASQPPQIIVVLSLADN